MAMMVIPPRLLARPVVKAKLPMPNLAHVHPLPLAPVILGRRAASRSETVVHGPRAKLFLHTRACLRASSIRYEAAIRHGVGTHEQYEQYFAVSGLILGPVWKDVWVPLIKPKAKAEREPQQVEAILDFFKKLSQKGAQKLANEVSDAEATT